MIGNDQVRFGPGAVGKGPAFWVGTSPTAYRCPVTIMSCGHAGSGCRYAPSTPLVIEAAELASVEMAPAAPDGTALVPVLVLPGVRVYVDVSRTETEAARWWHELGVAALLAAASYDEHGSVSAR